MSVVHPDLPALRPQHNTTPPQHATAIAARNATQTFLIQINSKQLAGLDRLQNNQVGFDRGSTVHNGGSVHESLCPVQLRFRIM